MLKEKICMMMVMMIMGGGQLRDRLESIVKNGCQISGRKVGMTMVNV